MLCVSRTSTPSAAMKLISPRDFVDLVLVKKYEDGTISSNGEWYPVATGYMGTCWVVLYTLHTLNDSQQPEAAKNSLKPQPPALAHTCL